MARGLFFPLFFAVLDAIGSAPRQNECGGGATGNIMEYVSMLEMMLHYRHVAFYTSRAFWSKTKTKQTKKNKQTEQNKITRIKKRKKITEKTRILEQNGRNSFEFMTRYAEVYISLHTQ